MYNFEQRFNRRRSFIKTMFFLALGIILLLFIFSATMFIKAKYEGKSVYTIEVLSYQGNHFYQSDSIISQSPNVVVFMDLYGRVQTVSGQNIIVTKY